MTDLRWFLITVCDDDATPGIVLESGSPDFFIAHGDMAFIDDPHPFHEIARGARLNVFRTSGELVRELLQVTIVKYAGMAGRRRRVHRRLRHGVRFD